jgi:hypothetical protein
VVFVTFFLFVLLALIMWRVLFVGLQRLPSSGEIAPLQRRRDHRLTFGFLNFESNSCRVAPDTARDRAKKYLLRVAALTSATRVGDGYVVDVGTNTFQVRERYISRLRGAPNAKRRYEQTCYFCPNTAIPAAERMATALLMIKNNPALFDKWAGSNGLSFKADGQTWTPRE